MGVNSPESPVPVTDQTNSSDPDIDIVYVSPDVQTAANGSRVDFSKDVTAGQPDAEPGADSTKE